MNAVVGTPIYVAPEVFEGYYDFKCDVWSIGIILYMMLTGGHSPFEGNTDVEMLKCIKETVLDFSADMYKHISDDAKDLLSKMLEKDP